MGALTLGKLISLAMTIISEGGKVFQFWEDERLGKLSLGDRIPTEHIPVIVTAFPKGYDWVQAAADAGVS